jgi:V/A-type H+-transporting ATPase subunit C
LGFWVMFHMDNRYAYAVGKIRAREVRLLDLPKLLSILQAENVEEALKRLSDTDYREGLALVKQEADFDSHLSRQMESVYHLISGLTRDPQLTDLFILGNDFHNIKVAFKKKYGASVEEEYYLAPSIVNREELVEAVKTGNYGRLPPPLAGALQKTEGIYSSEKNIQLIDTTLDEIYLSHCLQVSRQAKCEFLEKLFLIQIDLTNIRTFLRLKEMAKGRDSLEKCLISGGVLERDLFLKSFAGSLESFVDSLRFKDYYEILNSGVEHWGKSGSFSFLEKLFDDYLLNFVKKAKYISFGIEPLIGYLVAKEMEVKNLRTVIVGKFNGLFPEIIKGRLREVYTASRDH